MNRPEMDYQTLMQQGSVAHLVAALQREQPASLSQSQRKAIEQITIPHHNSLHIVDDCKLREELLHDLEKLVKHSLLPQIFGTQDPDNVGGIIIIPGRVQDAAASIMSAQHQNTGNPGEVLAMEQFSSRTSGAPSKLQISAGGGEGSQVSTRSKELPYPAAPNSIMLDALDRRMQTLTMTLTNPVLIPSYDTKQRERYLREPLPQVIGLSRGVISALSSISEYLLEQTVIECRRVHMMNLMPTEGSEEPPMDVGTVQQALRNLSDGR